MSLMEQKVDRYKQDVGGLSQTLPHVAEAYHEFTGECFSPGELDERTKQLIALGVALYANNEVCTFYHVQEAKAKGASERQILETAAVVAAAASGHAMSQGVMRVQGALRAAGGEGVRPFPAQDTIVPHIRPAGVQDYLQDTEFADQMDLEGMVYAGRGSIPPSY